MDNAKMDNAIFNEALCLNVWVSMGHGWPILQGAWSISRPPANGHTPPKWRIAKSGPLNDVSPKKVNQMTYHQMNPNDVF